MSRAKEIADPGGGAAATKEILLVIAAAALWSTGGVGVKVLEAEPLVVAGLRSAFALVFMLVVIATQLRGRLGVLATLLKRPLVWAAAASYALMVVTFVLAARRTTAANAVFIQYTGAIYIALLSGPSSERSRRGAICSRSARVPSAWR